MKVSSTFIVLKTIIRKTVFSTVNAKVSYHYFQNQRHQSLNLGNLKMKKKAKRLGNPERRELNLQNRFLFHGSQHTLLRLAVLKEIHCQEFIDRAA
jgi:hypothetical protein